jgi:hypothetical protein
MVTLPEGDRRQKQVIFRAAMRAFEDCHGRTMRLFARQDQRFPSLDCGARESERSVEFRSMRQVADAVGLLCVIEG